jgi:hypothetical protein
MSLSKYLIIHCLGIGIGLSANGNPAGRLRAGPLYDEFSLTLSPGHRAEALGPFFSLEQKDSQHQWAIPPLFSHTADPETDFEEFDLAYPLLTYDRFGAEYRFQFFQLLSFSGGQDQDETPKHRLSLFPFYFQQRSTEPAQDYTAFVPFYGHLKDRLFRDEIRFVMFPLYSKTRKRDVVTENYLYPLFHVRHGEALRGWQFWPLVGHEHKEMTVRTNQFDEVEAVGGHDKLFVLWPFFFNQQNGIGPDHLQKQQALLPLYSVTRSPQRDSSTYLWPFFTHTDEREKKYQEWGAPWPLVVVARGEGKTTTRLWPLFSHAQNTNQQSDFYLWPVYKYNRLHSDPLDRERTRILFFLYSDTTERNTATSNALHRTDFWPLFTRRRDFNGNERLQVLSLLEPLLPNNKSVERNYSPLWSLWRAERNATTGATSQSLLWNLYRHETTPAGKKCSLLFGLFQYQSDAHQKHWRLFYIPFGKGQSRAEEQSSHGTQDVVRDP